MKKENIKLEDYSIFLEGRLKTQCLHEIKEYKLYLGNNFVIGNHEYCFTVDPLLPQHVSSICSGMKWEVGSVTSDLWGAIRI